MKIVTTAEMRRIERAADSGGLAYAAMMENAGRAVADVVEMYLQGIPERRALILVGPGNNGGDGLVAGRYLDTAGVLVTIYIWQRDTAHDANYQQAQERGVEIIFSEQDPEFATLRERVAQTAVLVDALLGTGVTRPLEGTLKTMLEVVAAEIAARQGEASAPDTLYAVSDIPAPINDRPRVPPVIAVDVPSGVNCDTGAVDAATLAATTTVTFGFPKLGQFMFPGAAQVGKLVIADIAIPRDLAGDVARELLTADLVHGLLPQRPLDAHKGTCGSALIIAGSVNYTGAAYLAGAAATRSGAGLVTLGLSALVYPVVAAKLTEATYLLLADNMGALTVGGVKVVREKLARYRALLVGPGLGQEHVTVEFIHQLLGIPDQAAHKPRVGFIPAVAQGQAAPETETALPALVIDADGLNALAKAAEWWEHIPRSSILTPHVGEMSRLTGKSVTEISADRLRGAGDAAREWGHIVVLKGAYTVIATPEGEIFVNPFANPGLASAGTGDVLAGIIVGMLAQGLTPRAAAIVGVYLHGLAGELARAALGEAGMVASDLLPRLPEAWQILQG